MADSAQNDHALLPVPMNWALYVHMADRCGSIKILI